MAARTSLRIPVDEDLVWLLQQGEAELGRNSAFREGGNGSGSNDYERKITDERFSFARTPAARVERARHLGARFRALPCHHRDVLALTYGLPGPVLRSQILAAANLQAWQAVERAFGGLAGVALLFTSVAADEPAKLRRSGDDVGGVWRSAPGLAFLALCLRGKAAELEPVQASVAAALGAALGHWWGVGAEGRRVA